VYGGTTRATASAMTESFPARSGNGQTYAFPPYVSGELSGRVTTLAAVLRHAMLAQAVVLWQNAEMQCR